MKPTKTFFVLFYVGFTLFIINFVRILYNEAGEEFWIVTLLTALSWVMVMLKTVQYQIWAIKK